MDCQVIYKKPSAEWHVQGGIADPDSDRVVTEDDGRTFFYQKWCVNFVFFYYNCLFKSSF